MLASDTSCTSITDDDTVNDGLVYGLFAQLAINTDSVSLPDPDAIDGNETDTAELELVSPEVLNTDC